MSSMECLLDANRGKLFAYLLRVAGDSDTARDILQESVTRCIERYRDRDISLSLLFTVARNTFIDHVRKSGRNVVFEDLHADPRADQEHTAIVRDRFRKVLQGLQTLREDERDILSMVVSSDLSYEEISRVTAMSVSNVKVTVHRARIKLKKYLEGEGHG